jgi:pimeloyl-ACP methyl ester carboxylesterase
VIVNRTRRIAAISLSVGLLAAGLTASAPALASTQTCGGTGSVTTVNGTLSDGATTLIECPAGPWNGTLFLYSHGYVVPGTPNPAQDVGDPITRAWMLGHGFALAGSSYATTGWAIQQALPDQINTLAAFTSTYGAPTHTIAWGHSLGGIITAGLIQQYPSDFNAALPMCGVLSGGVATWNTALDGAFAFQQLIDPSVQVVNISNPNTNVGAALTAATAAQKTAQGRARLALSAALADTPGWFTPLSPEPAPTNYKAQEANQFLWASQVDYPFAFALRAELEFRAGGNVSWNTGVNYATQLSKSADAAEVKALYKAAGLSLSADLDTLNDAPRISADPTAVNYLEQNITFNGKISMPVLTMHTTGDGLVVNQNEQAYDSVVDGAGNAALLQQIFVHRAGHCAFTPAEQITAVRALLHRLSTGRWDLPSLTPGGLNRRAAALGPTYNVFQANGKLVPTPPMFVHFRPTVYLRPFPQGSPIP